MGQSVLEDAQTPLNIPLCAKYMRSFAYATMKDRVPVILTKALDGLVRDKENIISCYGEVAREELKKVIGYISQLKNELQTDKPFIALSSLGDDADLWNQHLKNSTKEHGFIPSYFQTDWMYAECYVYRRLREAFLITSDEIHKKKNINSCALTKMFQVERELFLKDDLLYTMIPAICDEELTLRIDEVNKRMKSLQNIDPFHHNKADALEESMKTVRQLALHMNEIAVSNKFSTKEQIKNEFIHLLKFALWGNKCDLSLSCGGSVIIKDDPFKWVEKFDSFLLVDQSEDVWNTLADCKGETIDIILDNAGYEFVTDLCLAEFLVTKCDISKVRFRAKKIPWYVSDVMEKDFHYVINTIAEKEEPFTEIASRWLNFLKQGKFEVICDTFWTLPHSYSAMEKVDKKLYDDLKTSKLLIFKGDLNYRKLVGDINWPTTYPFKNALRSFHPSPLVTLRTLKADVICGLKPGQAEETEARALKWQLTGDFAVIQFDSEKHSA